MTNFFNRIAQTFRSSIRNQFATQITLLAVVAVVILGLALVSFAINQTRTALQASALAQLVSVRAIKREQLTTYFTERSGNIQLNSGTQATRESLAAFSNGFAQSSPETIRSLYLGKIEQADAGDGSAFTSAHIQFTPYLSSIVKTFGFYDVFVITRNGQVVYTYAKEDDFGTNLVNGKYADTNLAEVYRKALQLPAGEIAVSDFEFYAPSANAPAAFIAAPIYDSGQVIGVLAAQLPVDRISAIMQERTGLGETGETYLVGADLLFRSESRFAENTLLNQKVDTTASNKALAGEAGYAVILDYRGIPVFSSWEPFEFKDLRWAFLAEIDEAEALAPADRLANLLVSVSVAISLAIALVAVLVATRLARTFSNPVINLAQTAQIISGGNFDVEIKSGREDELGTLADAFRVMVSRVRELIAGLEKRSAELATVAEVGTVTATILETNRLLQEVVDLTKERFNLYHSHIYLLDEERKNLVLAAGAGEPGRQMVKEGRSIPLDREQSLVARAARERKGVTVNDVTQAPDFLPNPLLPDTRSELAVPMIVGENVIGVFDVQSEQAGRFGESDINIQTTLAAQVATSIQNVRSFEQSKTQAELESLVNTISQKIQRATTVEDTLQTAIRELGSALGASRVKADIRRPDSDSTVRVNYETVS
ncbi:MAG: GAF domain-containing protein [Chloroflexi bacterium]|nr:GAF domain-containing protein [Chloroflexota bacterium]